MGGGPEQPLFLDKHGSDDNHPVFIAVQAYPCVAPEITIMPDGDMLSGSHCDELFFDFVADPGMEGSSPATIEEWTVISGIGTIDNSGHYLVEPQPIGVYPVIIQVTNSCFHSDTYSFDVIFTNDAPVFTNCRNNCSSNYYYAPHGDIFSLPLGVTEADVCDTVSLVITGFDIIWGGWYYGDLYLDGNVLVIFPTDLDGDVILCVEVTAFDGQGGEAVCEIGYEICCHDCGQVDHLGIVDIDDAVFLINYVFASGFPPEPYDMGDVNCSGAVDIDDIVHLVTYVFGGGNIPCDVDGDGVEDCW
jgi:hypothetical protein